MIDLNAAYLDQLASYEQLYVGFSGGLDSSVLLYYLFTQPRLRPKLRAIHINHGLSLNAMHWQNHCQQICQQWQIPYIPITICCDAIANIEENARIARYTAFAELIQLNDCLLLGHHLDDQAETVLLQLFRGAGIDGLAAIASHGTIGLGDLHRPLLNFSRQELLDYALAQQLTWIEDESNQNLRFARNFIRQTVMPLLQQKWPAVNKNLARTAMHCQQGQTNLDDLAVLDCSTLNSPILPLHSLLDLPLNRLSNVLRYWLRRNQVRLPNAVTFMRLIDEVIYASIDAKPLISWDQVEVRRYQQALYLIKNHLTSPLVTTPWLLFPEPLQLAQGTLRAIPAANGFNLPQGSALEVRSRQGGEAMVYQGHTHSLKKLMQQWRIPPWQRDKLPLLYIDGQLAAVAGYGYDDRFYQQGKKNSFSIEWDFFE